MKTTSAFMAVCTALLMFSCSGDDENSQSTPLQLKTTTSSPAKGEIGTKITIIGENFTDQAKVYLKNAKATITSVTATQLQVIAPANEAGECIIEVMVGAQKTENLRFTYVDYTPVVSSISPSSGTENTEITIIGENFSTTPEENIVKIGDAIATVTSKRNRNLCSNRLCRCKNRQKSGSFHIRRYKREDLRMYTKFHHCT